MSPPPRCSEEQRGVSGRAAGASLRAGLADLHRYLSNHHTVVVNLGDVRFTEVVHTVGGERELLGHHQNDFRIKMGY